MEKKIQPKKRLLTSFDKCLVTVSNIDSNRSQTIIWGRFIFVGCWKLFKIIWPGHLSGTSYWIQYISNLVGNSQVSKTLESKIFATKCIFHLICNFWSSLGLRQHSGSTYCRDRQDLTFLGHCFAKETLPNVLDCGVKIQRLPGLHMFLILSSIPDLKLVPTF